MQIDVSDNFNFSRVEQPLCKLIYHEKNTYALEKTTRCELVRSDAAIEINENLRLSLLRDNLTEFYTYSPSVFH